MTNPPRKIAFAILATDHGTLITNRLDTSLGRRLLDCSSNDAREAELMLKLVELRRRCYGNGVLAVDGGANIGVYTIELAKFMTGWGTVLAFEAQERLYYALAGNIALNNCFNAQAVHAAIASQSGVMQIPNPNYLIPSSFSGLELKQRINNEPIGQPISYAADQTVPVPMVALDNYALPRLDFLKLDIEGMELDALAGAADTVTRHHPILLVEMIKCGKAQLQAWLTEQGYALLEIGLNFLAVHKSDRCLAHIKPALKIKQDLISRCSPVAQKALPE